MEHDPCRQEAGKGKEEVKHTGSGGGGSAQKPGRRSGGHRSAHTGQASGGGKAPHKKKYPYTLKQIRQYNRKHPHKSRGLSLDGETVEFGRTAPHDPFTHPRLIIDRLVDTSALPAPPPTVDRASRVTSWPVYGNDRIGDCTCAAAGHEIQAWTAYGTGEATIGEADVIAAYSAITGYDPATGANDNGANVQDVLDYWRKTGIGSHQIGGFAQLTGLDNLVLAKQCLDIFGTIYLGIEVPQSAMDQFRAGKPWDYAGDRNILGGHAIPVQYWTTHRYGEIEVVTWGKRQRMTHSFWHNYVEEAWVVFSQDSLDNHSGTAGGFNVDQLRAAFTDLTGQPAGF